MSEKSYRLIGNATRGFAGLAKWRRGRWRIQPFRRGFAGLAKWLPGGRRIQPFCRGFLWLAGGKCAAHYGRFAPGAGGWRRLRRCAGGRGDVSAPGAGAPFLTHALTAGMLTPKVRAMEVNELPS